MTERELHLHTEAVLRTESLKRGGNPVLERWADNFAARAAALDTRPIQRDLFEASA